MNHYLDLNLLPDPEFPATHLMSALMAKLHRGLHDLRRNDIGISFPDVESTEHGLGQRLRLHGTSDAIESLMALSWLTGMHDHLTVGILSSVPTHVRYRCVSRLQVDSNPERLRRRLIKRHGLTVEEARQRIPESTAKHCDLPFVSLRSSSNGNTYRLFINHGPLLEQSSPGHFGSYGLSSTATIPWF